MKCNGIPSWKAIDSHGLKFPELNGWEKHQKYWAFLLTQFSLHSHQKNPKNSPAQNPQPALGNRCLCVTWFPSCCLLPAVLSTPAAREDSRHSGSQKVILLCCCWLKNHLALHMPPPKLDLATMKHRRSQADGTAEVFRETPLTSLCVAFFPEGPFL